MIPAVLSIGFAGLVSLIVVAASMSATRRLWKGREHLGIAYGIGGLAAASYLSFIATWLNPILGIVLAWLVIAAGVAVLGLARAWRGWRGAIPLVLVIGGILITYVGILYLWHFPEGAFSLSAQRFTSGPLPTDNLIPYLFSERLAAAQSTHLLIGDWNGSDRPPLQAGLILLVRAPAGLIAGPQSGAFGASIIAQLIWVPALFAFLRSLGTPKRAALLAVLMAAATGTTMLNTVYTWPKMMSAALILCSAVFLVDAVRRPRGFGRSFVIAVIVFVFALLAHGAAAFALPLLVVLGVIAYRRQRARPVIAWTALSVVTGLAVYLPWLLYGRFADPPGDRLLKWHLAGVLSPSDSRSFAEIAIKAYRALSPSEWLAGRVANLQTAFDIDLLRGIGAIADRRSAEFLRATVAIGLACPAILLILLLILLELVRRRGVSTASRPFLLMTVASVLSIVFWCVLMFIPGSAVVHQGSQVWLLLLLAAPAAWIAQADLRFGVALVALQWTLTLAVYLPMVNAQAVDPVAIPLVPGGVLLCGLSLRLVGRPIRAAKIGIS